MRSSSGWLIGGHAVRLAYEIACHTAFQKLLRLGMGRGKTGKELEEQRPLVTMARVWFCLVSILPLVITPSLSG